MQPSTVLFLAANPLRVQPLQLGEECRAIENKIRAAKFRDQIRFHSRWAARPDDVLQALNEDAPSVLHFSGHGAGDRGLCFQSEDGSAQHVSAEGLAQVMRAAGASVKVVILNACYSEVQAQALVAHVPCVIGMPDAIGDEAAIIYAASFYGALAFGKSVANAHQQGLAALALLSTSGPTRDVQVAERDVQAAEVTLQSITPTLLIRSDIDADHVYIVYTSEDPVESHPPSPSDVPTQGGLIAKPRHREWGIYKLLIILLFLFTSAVAIRVVFPWGKPLPSTGSPFGLAVRLHGPAGFFDKVCTSGTVTLDIGTDRRIEAITNEGEARFTEIPQSFINKSVPIGVSCDEYVVEGFSQITLTPDQVYYVSMRKCGNCSIATNDAGVDAIGELDAAMGLDAAVREPVRRGPCTRTPGTILHSPSEKCPKLNPNEPDAREIAREEKERGYTCTDIYRCR